MSQPHPVAFNSGGNVILNNKEMLAKLRAWDRSHRAVPRQKFGQIVPDSEQRKRSQK